MDTDGPHVEPDRWGHDHMTTLAYLETCSVDGDGSISREKMRTGTHHPLLAGRMNGVGNYPTRLRGGELLDGHDDWDCCNDLEREGYIAWCTGAHPGSGAIKPRVQVNIAGSNLVSAYRRHRAEGGTAANFDAKAVIAEALYQDRAK